ncbi:MAG: hypothetical protein AAGG68_04275 [Bacteroidota bacterium]
MLKTIIIFSLFFVLPLYSFTQRSVTYEWTKDSIYHHANEQMDEDKWNLKLLKADQEWGAKRDHLPQIDGVFPVPPYSTGGIGSLNIQLNTLNKSIKGTTFFLRKSAYNAHRFPANNDATTEIVGVILVVGGGKSKSLVSSRNHPYYVAQGKIESNHKPVDWTIIQIPDGKVYALVNMRLFDLSAGKLIIIAPQADKTYRSWQTTIPFSSKQNIQDILEEVTKQEALLAFLKEYGS